MSDPPLCSIGDDCRGITPTGVQLEPRDVWDNGYLCGSCRQRLGRWIRDMPTLHQDLAEALQPVGGVGGGKPSYRNAWPINPALLGELRYEYDIWGKLASWGRLLIDEGIDAPIIATGDIAALALWLTAGKLLDTIAHREWADIMYLEIGGLWYDLRRVAYPEHNRKRFPLPRSYRCPECASELVAHVDPTGTAVICSGCELEWIPMQWHRLGRRILGASVLAQVNDY